MIGLTSIKVKDHGFIGKFLYLRIPVLVSYMKSFEVFFITFYDDFNDNMHTNLRIRPSKGLIEYIYMCIFPIRYDVTI